MTTALVLGAALLILAGLWLLYEMKPLVLRDPRSQTVSVAKDEAALVALLDLTYRPEIPGTGQRLASVTESGRVLSLPNGTKVKVLNRKLYKEGRLSTMLTIRKVRTEGDNSSAEPGSTVEQVKVVSASGAGLTVWVDGRYCKKSKLPI